MKRLFAYLLILTLTVSISGCGGKPTTGQEQKSETTSTASSTETDLNKAGDDLAKAMETLAVKGWPKDKLPADLPEYTEGSIVNSGGSKTEFYIKIEKTDKEALDRYLAKLKSLNWNLSENNSQEVKKGIYSLDFTWQGGGTMLQMIIYTSQLSQWPKDTIPTDIIPPKNCTFIGDISITETEKDRMWYFGYECQGIDAAAAKDYLEELRNNGWSGDDPMVFKDFEWKGQKCSASIEIYETVGDTTTFTCNFNVI